jgi:protein arginine N-methyltransferase 1
MLLPTLQRLSAGFFLGLRRGLGRCGDWLHEQPRLTGWFYPPRDDEAVEADYREFNLRYFAGFGEQEKMLADRPRMDFYHAAITQLVRPGDRVIDLGTGTGILAAFAARRGAAQVWAIDHSDILEHARRLARHNALPNVEFVARHSRDFVAAERVDVILHEQMGDFLFDEGMVANVLDLRDRLLRRDGRIVPSRFEFFCEPIRLRESRRIPFIWELDVHGYDYACLERHRPQEPHYYRLNSSDLGVVECFLGEAEPALAFDLMTLEADELPRELRVSRTVIHPGRLDGCAIFFRARVDDDLVLSSSPLDPGRAPHWGFRILRCEAADYAAGDTVEVLLRAPDWSEPDTWRWECTRRPAAPGPGGSGITEGGLAQARS